MKTAIFISGNQNKIDYLSKTLGLDIPHQKVDLDEIQSSDPKFVIEHKVKQAYKIIEKLVIYRDIHAQVN